MDRYSEKWASLANRDSHTNYEHNIQSGHLSHYFDKLGNLYKYSQQGFEAMMSKIKCIYGRCTMPGGNGAEVRSHILQECHFFIQMMLWNSVYGDIYFKRKYNDSAVDNNDLFL